MSARKWNGLRSWLLAEDEWITASRIHMPPEWCWEDAGVDGRVEKRGTGVTSLREDPWPVVEDEWWWQHAEALVTLPALFWRSKITVSPDEFMDMEEFDRDSCPPPVTLESHAVGSVPFPLRRHCFCLETRKFILSHWWCNIIAKLQSAIYPTSDTSYCKNEQVFDFWLPRMGVNVHIQYPKSLGMQTVLVPCALQCKDLRSSISVGYFMILSTARL